MKQLLLIISFLFFYMQWVHAQLEIAMYGGIHSSLVDANADYTENVSQLGALAGLEIRNSGTLHVGLGAYWHQLKTEFTTANEEVEVISFNQLNMPFQLGWNILNTENVRFRAYAAGTITYILSISDNSINITHENNDQIQFGYQAGLGFDARPICFKAYIDQGPLALDITTEGELDHRIIAFSMGLFF